MLSTKQLRPQQWRLRGAVCKYHYNKEVCAQGHVEVMYIRSAENLADLFTKAVPTGVLRHLLDKLLGYDPFTDEDARAHVKEKAELEKE